MNTRESTTVALFDYDLGQNGKRLGITDEFETGSSTTWEYEYDGLDRLISATETEAVGSTTTEYTYDEAGNRTRKETGDNATVYHYNDLDQLFEEIQYFDGEIHRYYGCFYDGNGNLRQKLWEDEGNVYGWTYVYDSRNKLKEVYKGEGEDPSGILAAYAYDFAGNRVAKMTADDYGVKTTTQFLVDNNNLTGYSQVLLDITYPCGNILSRLTPTGRWLRHSNASVYSIKNPTGPESGFLGNVRLWGRFVRADQ